MRVGGLGVIVAAAMAAAVGGCASDGSSMLTTGAVSQQKKVVATAVDPACLALHNRIELLRSEGTVGRVEKAATGKSKTVVIKRAALTKVSELNQANAEFQQRCSTLPKAALAPAKPSAAAQKVARSTATLKRKVVQTQQAVTNTVKQQ